MYTNASETTKVGMLMLSHHELELSHFSILDNPVKHAIARKSFRHWTGQLWRGEKCKSDDPSEYSEQEKPYESHRDMRTYDLSDLVSIGAADSTDVQHDTRTDQITMQHPEDRYLRLKFLEESGCNDYHDGIDINVPEHQQKYQILVLSLKTPRETLLLVEVLQKFKDSFRSPFIPYEFTFQPRAHLPTFLIEPSSSLPGETVQEDISIPCFPHLLSHTYPRPQLLASLSAIILQPFLPRRIIAVAGPCGAGKSVLAAQVCHHPAVCRIFEDRIFWIAIGQGVGNQSLRLLEVLQKLATGLHSVVLTKKAVGEVMQRPFKFQTIDQALNWTREAVSRSRLSCLVVLDDVWERQVVEILFQTQCCLLVTSPDRSYLSGIGAEWIDVGPMGEEDASALAGMTDPRDVWKGIGMLPLPLKQSSIVASFLGGWIEFWFEFEEAKKALLQSQFYVNILKTQQDHCGSTTEERDTTSLIVVTTVALSAAGDLLNSRNSGSDWARFSGTKLHDQGVVDIQVLYIMLAALPFGLAVPEAVLQAIWWGSSPDGIASAERPKEYFLLLQRIEDIDGRELFLVNHAQSIYIRALAETKDHLVRTAHMRLKEYLGTIPALLGLGRRSCLYGDPDYIAKWPIELYGGFGRYGILDALKTHVGGLSYDLLTQQCQEALDYAVFQKDDSNRSSPDSNSFSIAATLASICDVLCMPRNVAAAHSFIETSNSGYCLDTDLVDDIVSLKVPAFSGYCMALELLEKLPQFGCSDGGSPESFYLEQGKMWSSLAHTLAKAGCVNYALMIYQRAIELYLAVAWKGSQQHEHFWRYSNECGAIRQDRRMMFQPMRSHRRKDFLGGKRDIGGAAVSPSSPERTSYSTLNVASGYQHDEGSWEPDVAFCCVDELGYVLSVANDLARNGDHSSAQAVLERGLAVYKVLLGDTHPLTLLARQQFIHIVKTAEPHSQSQKNGGRVNRHHKGPIGGNGDTVIKEDEKRCLGMVKPSISAPDQEVGVANHPYDMVMPCHDTLAMFSMFDLAPRCPGTAMSLLELIRQQQCSCNARNVEGPESNEKRDNILWRRSDLLEPLGKGHEKRLAYGYLITCAAKFLEEECLSQNEEEDEHLLPYPISS